MLCRTDLGFGLSYRQVAEDWNRQGSCAVYPYVKTSSSRSDGDAADPVIGCPTDGRARFHEEAGGSIE